MRKTLPLFLIFILDPKKWFRPAAKKSTRIYSHKKTKSRRSIYPGVLKFEEQESSLPRNTSQLDWQETSLTSEYVNKREHLAAGIPWKIRVHNENPWRSGVTKPVYKKARSSVQSPNISSTLVFATGSSLAPSPFWTAKDLDWKEATSAMMFEHDTGRGMKAKTTTNDDGILQHQPGGLPLLHVRQSLKRAVAFAAEKSVTVTAPCPTIPFSSNSATTAVDLVFINQPPFLRTSPVRHNWPEPAPPYPLIENVQPLAARLSESPSEPLPGKCFATLASHLPGHPRYIEMTPCPEERQRPVFTFAPPGKRSSTPLETLLAKTSARRVALPLPSKEISSKL